MFQIGEFSRIATVTIETLRHYDAIGLFKPAKVDPFTGYRYYKADQLQKLHQILSLKDIGLSLEEIKQILYENPTTETMRDMLNAQLASTEKIIDEAQRRHKRLIARLQSLEDTTAPSYDVNVKSVQTLTIATIRETIPTIAQIPQRWNALFTTIAEWANANKLSIGFPMALYHDEGYTSTQIDTECAFILHGQNIPEPKQPILIRQLDAIPQVASVVVAGFQHKVDGLKPAYIALGQWVANNGYHITAAPREIYYGSPQTGDFTAEIQFPITKLSYTG